MKKINKDVITKKSLLGNNWSIKKTEERLVLSIAQKNNISFLLSKLLITRNIESDSVLDFLNSNIHFNIPNPFKISDMQISVERVFKALKNNDKIGIIADYDVDGSTSAALLFKFLRNFTKNIILKTPNRLSEGYGPNLRIMDELLNENVNLIFTLDCGTSSKNIIDNKKYINIDVIVIDHHLGENLKPNVFSIINPNKDNENSEFNNLAAVGVTFLFLMALRKFLREKNFFSDSFNEPNLLSYLDLVALGTVCDVVKLVNYNRIFVKKGLEIIKKRKNIGITSIIDNSKLQSSPTSSDLGFLIGPQLNAASRIDDSSLPSKLLISNNIEEVELITRKLNLLNEKRKLIENNIFDESLIQADNQIQNKFILVYGNNWHNGVLGIVASKLINKFYKPAIVISFTNKIGIGSARSIGSIDLGNIILNAKNNNFLLSGGGHKMAAGLSINYDSLDKFIKFVNDSLKKYPLEIFQKTEYFDMELSCNQINLDLLEAIEKIEPFGAGNPEPNFLIKDLNIEMVKILKHKHLVVFFKNDFSLNLKAICFNCIGTILGDHLLNFRNNKLAIGCSIKRDNFNNLNSAQIIIKDAMIMTK